MAEAELDDVFIDDIKLQAADGTALAATLFLPRRARRRQAVLINSAAAVPRKIYRGFASYLAGRGCAVLTYDYRGIGGSRPKSLVGFPAKMSDWAKLDATAAVNWMRTRYKELPLNVVGHSFGGQAVGLIANNTEIQRTLFVSAQAAYWRLLTSPERYRVYTMLKYLGRPLARVKGYVPGRFGLGEDMPKDVFLQWTSWVMSPRYFFTDDTLEGRGNFEKYRGELRALCITDDPWATRPAVEMLCSGFTGIEPEIIDVTPKENDAGQIGHFGFFRPQHRTTLWRKAGNWLTGEEEVVAPAVVSEPKTSAVTDATGGVPATIAPIDAVATADASTPAPGNEPSAETAAGAPPAIAVVNADEIKAEDSKAAEPPAKAPATAVDPSDVEMLLARFHALRAPPPNTGYSAASRT